MPLQLSLSTANRRRQHDLKPGFIIALLFGLWLIAPTPGSGAVHEQPREKLSSQANQAWLAMRSIEKPLDRTIHCANPPRPGR